MWLGARCGAELSSVRGQDERDKWKQTSFFLEIQRQRLAATVQPGQFLDNGFGLELDSGKAWRSRLPGALEGRYEHGVEGTKCRECRASWAGAVFVGRGE